MAIAFRRFHPFSRELGRAAQRMRIALRFPQPATVGDQHGYSMIGFVKKNTEEVMKSRISRRAPLVCPNGVNFVDIKFDDSGVHPMGATRYEAVFTCKS